MTLTAEPPFSRNTFDPRKHSAVNIAISERLSCRGPSGEQEAPIKCFTVGPNVPPPSLSLRRRAGCSLRPTASGSYDPQPRFLSEKGQWVPNEMPNLIADSQAQSLTATSTFTSSMPGAANRPGRQIRPVTACHSYHDISPVISGDAVMDCDLDRTMVKESTQRRPFSAMADMQTGRAHTGLRMSLPNTSSLDITKPLGANKVPDTRNNSIKEFWARQAGIEFNLKIKDLKRVEELGRNIPPGSPNTRLIGSKWCYIQRPVDGDAIWTDYYGRCGPKANDYYGRAYNPRLKQYNSNRVVGDLDYIKVQASMPGINTLRTRPGLSVDTTIVTGPAERLDGLTVKQAQTAHGLHRLKEFARMKPGSVAQVRDAWVS